MKNGRVRKVKKIKIIIDFILFIIMLFMEISLIAYFISYNNIGVAIVGGLIEAITIFIFFLNARFRSKFL